MISTYDDTAIMTGVGLATPPGNERRAEVQSRARTVALAILNPHDFDNHQFWALVYEAGLQDMIPTPATEAGFRDLVENFPLRDGNLTVSLLCPYLEPLVEQFHAHLSSDDYGRIKEILKNILVPSSFLCRGEIDNLFTRVAGQHESLSVPSGPLLGDDDLASPAVRRPYVDLPQSSYSAGFVGHPDFIPPTPPSASNWMKILGGFMMALGAVAVVVAFAALNAATLGTTGLAVAGLGVASMLGGFGLFRMGGASPSSPPPPAILQTRDEDELTLLSC